MDMSPTSAVIKCNGIGFEIQLSLHTFEKIKDKTDLLIWTHYYVKEDIRTLFGFADKEERHLFVQLLSVNGIGPSTARMVLSSMTPNDFLSAIRNEQVALLKSIKGIGPKAAQRMILELKDKLKDIIFEGEALLTSAGDAYSETLDALMALGFGKAAAEKAMAKVKKMSQENLNTEQWIKHSLKIL